ncbi:MAG: ubiquinol-cytochrome C chaperone family protein [Candidatus Andeanibacterium colombiense]|uniref:Ubiquinol-cytochrome C chaperone family protein n=1 Tax=Candidatus Andeanibacterium colombiense TaxID=3121345 RepID=A0AAJ6BNH8_9SPHN|nr:MAG: ubiquinol-cytochrome C chaperone family protein [Sphingomonadaceae bacterium]
MSLLSRLFSRSADPREAVRPLWHRVVEIAREKRWYAEGGIADTVTGRFDAITLVMVAVLLRMDRNPELAQPSTHLTELFIEDMDGQLRESGIGDLVVGKHVTRLMGVLGGRLGALRDGLARPDDAELTAAIERNVSFSDNGSPAAVAQDLRALAGHLADLSDFELLEGRIGR